MYSALNCDWLHLFSTNFRWNFTDFLVKPICVFGLESLLASVHRFIIAINVSCCRSVQKLFWTSSFVQNGWAFGQTHLRKSSFLLNVPSLILCQFKMPQTLLFRNVAQCESMQGQKLRSSWFQMSLEAAQKVILMYLTFPTASLRVCWVVSHFGFLLGAHHKWPTSFFFLDCRLALEFKMQKTATFFYITEPNSFHIMFSANVPSGFEKHTTSPINFCDNN